MKLIKNFFYFNKLQETFNEIIFYSEGSHDTIYFQEIIEFLDNKYNKQIIILTSDEKDICHKLQSKNVKIIYIGSGFIRTLIFYLIKSKIFVTSLPDIENFFLKRSRVSNTKYIYIFHSVSSTNAAYNKRAFDNYDYIFCRGQHQIDEIKENEELNNLKRKYLLKHGCPVFDKIAVDIKDINWISNKILIAPSWNKQNELIDLNLEELINTLMDNQFEVTLRFHPMTTRRKFEKIQILQKKYVNNNNFKLSSNMENKNDLYDNDILITDWSGISWEFSLMLGKPTIFVDIPKKIMNSDYYHFKNQALEITLREKIGFLFGMNDYKKIVNKINSREFLDEFNSEKISNIKKYRKIMFFNPGQSSSTASKEIIKIIDS